MKNYWTILLLNLKMELGFLNPKTWKANKDTKSIRRILGIVILLFYVGGFTAFMEWKIMDTLVTLQEDARMAPVMDMLRAQGLSLPGILMVIVVLISMLLTLVYGMFQILSSLYFTKDTATYAALPVKSREVYAAKLTMVWLSETGVCALFILPLTVIYMIRTGFDLLFLLRSLLVTLFVPVIPLSICALLVGIISLFSGFWKHRDAFTLVGSLILVLLSFTISFSISSFTSNIEESAEGISEFLISLLTGRMDFVNTLTHIFPPASWAAKGLLGSLPMLGLQILVSLACVAVLLLLIGHKYLSQVATSSEISASGKKINIATVNYRSSSRLSALMHLEWLQIQRSPTYLLNAITGAFMVPILMTGGMVVGFGSAFDWDFSALREEIFGADFALTYIAIFLTAILSFMGGMNIISATAVSREGTRHGLLRSMHMGDRDILLAKVLVGLIPAVLGFILPCAAFTIIFPALWAQMLETLLWSSLLAYLFSCLALLIDIVHPKLHWNNENEAMKQNFNSVLSTLLGFAILGTLGYLTYLLLSHDMPFSTYAIIATLCLAALAFGGHMLLMHFGAKRYASIEG